MRGHANSLPPGRAFGSAALPVAAALGGIALAVSACGSSPPPPRPARLTIRAGQGSPDSRPDLGLAVSAQGGRLRNVTIADSYGHAVPGYTGSGGTTWHTTWALRPAQTYTVSAVAVNRAGKRTSLTRRVQTFTPAHTFSAQVNEDDGANVESGGVYGVGMPIMVSFSHPVTNRAAIERSFQLRTSKPVVGAWHWIDSTHVNFRPKDYWPQYTSVQFTAHLAGVEAAPGTFGNSDVQYNFKIGRSMVTYVSASSHHMQVYLNGSSKPAFDWPVSTGQPGDDTQDGHYVTMDKGNPVDMDSASFGVGPGSPGYYNVEVYDSVRFTWGGNYIHSAPWSVGEQGISNVSHGCVNLAPDHASWYYDHAHYGDPVIVTGSPAPGVPGDGWTDWFLSWPQLIKKSATGEAVVAGQDGSYFTNPQTATASPSPAPTAGRSGTAKPSRTARPSASARPSGGQ